MASLTVSVQRADHLADFPAALTELGQTYMGLAVNVAQLAVQRNAPVNIGRFRDSIANSVEVKGETITGSVFSQDEPIKVAVIEEGRAPNQKFPRLEVIRRWVHLKMGASIEVALTSIGPRRRGQKRLSRAATRRESEGDGAGPRNTPYNIALNRTAYLIGRKIAKEGIEGKHVFLRSFVETQPEVSRILGEEFPAALAKRL
jgi:hypothetical protein